MSLVRFRVARRGRVEIHERSGPDVLVGSGPTADLRLLDEKVADRHAHVLVRRGRAIVTDLGRARAGITRKAERLRAPVAVQPSEVLRLGDITVQVAVHDDDERGLVGRFVDGARVTTELDGLDEGVRRFRLDDHREVVTHDDRDFEWPALPNAERLEIGGRLLLLERLPEGVRAQALFEAVQQQLVSLPIEAAVVLACHLAEGVARHHAQHGAHGAIEPQRLHLGIDGSIALLVPGPKIDLSDPSLDPYLAPERRYGLAPSRAADAFAVARLARRLLADRPEAASLLGALEPAFATAPTDRDADLAALAARLRVRASASGLDATFQHAARATRLITARLARPLVAPEADRLA